MLKNTETFLSSLVYASTGLHIIYIREKSFKKSNQTALITNCFFDDSYIRLNLYELEVIGHHLIETRGFKKEYLALEVILHEICHYKQYKKFIKKHKWFTIIRYRTNSKKQNKCTNSLICIRWSYFSYITKY